MVNVINNYFSTVFNKETDNNILRSTEEFSHEDKLPLSSIYTYICIFNRAVSRGKACNFKSKIFIQKFF